MVYPDPTRISAKAAHTATVFWLHGLGDTGAGSAATPRHEWLAVCISSALVPAILCTCQSAAAADRTVIQRGSPPIPCFWHALTVLTRRWTDIAELWANGLPHVEFVFPTAPIQPVTINGGMPMTAWCAYTDQDEVACPKHSLRACDVHIAIV